MNVRVGAWWGLVPMCLCVACQEDAPEPEPVVTEITPLGGTARSEDGNLTIEFPPDAVIEPIDVSIRVSGDAPASIGPAYRVQPNINLREDAIVTYRYAASDVEGRELERLHVAYDSGGIWEQLPLLAADTGARTVTGNDGQISLHYGLI